MRLLLRTQHQGPSFDADKLKSGKYTNMKTTSTRSFFVVNTILFRRQHDPFSKTERNQNLLGLPLRHQNMNCLGQQRPVNCEPNEMEVPNLLHTDCTAA